MTDFQELMVALDMALTGKDERTVRHNVGQQHVATAEEWLIEGGEWYLSDGGYSRVCFSWDDLHLFPTSNSLEKVKTNWSSCEPQIVAVERALAAAEREALQ